MNASYRWLLDCVPGLELTPEEIGKHLALRGAPLDGVAYPAKGLEDVVMGQVVSAEKHPNACLLYTSPSPRDVEESRMPSSA